MPDPIEIIDDEELIKDPEFIDLLVETTEALYGEKKDDELSILEKYGY